MILKQFLPSIALICVMFGLSFAQEQSVSQPPIEPGAFSALEDSATLSVEDFRKETAKAIIEAAEKSDTLSRGEKRRIARVMRGGWFNESRKNKIIDAVTQKMHAEQVIMVTPLGVEAAVDWDAILSFIEKLIPLIVQLISLFGG